MKFVFIATCEKGERITAGCSKYLCFGYKEIQQSQLKSSDGKRWAGAGAPNVAVFSRSKSQASAGWGSAQGCMAADGNGYGSGA